MEPSTQSEINRLMSADEDDAESGHMQAAHSSHNRKVRLVAIFTFATLTVIAGVLALRSSNLTKVIKTGAPDAITQLDFNMVGSQVGNNNQIGVKTTVGVNKGQLVGGNNDGTFKNVVEAKKCEGSGNGVKGVGAAQVVCCYSPSGQACCGEAAAVKGRLLQQSTELARGQFPSWAAQLPSTATGGQCPSGSQAKALPEGCSQSDKDGSPFSVCCKGVFGTCCAATPTEAQQGAASKMGLTQCTMQMKRSVKGMSN